MEFADILVVILASIVGFIIGFLTDSTFIKRARNKRPYLTPIGVLIFGKNKGSYSEFITAGKATMIKIVDIIIGAAIGFGVYSFSIFVLSKTLIFYAPLFIISITSLYLLIRKGFGKIKALEWLIIALLYLISLVIIILIMKFSLNWF